MAIYQTLFDGRRYEVETFPENIDRPMHLYCHVYRLRKDSSRGLKLMAHRPEAWAVWQTVRGEAQLEVTV